MSGHEASKSEAEYFDQLIAERGDFNPFADRGWQTLRRRFAQLIDVSRPLDVLDVGCGTAQSRYVYEGYCRNYTGLDLSMAAIARAKRRFGDGMWCVSDATKLPFADHSFDVVAFSSVLHHIPNRAAAVREGFRVLRPGGHAFAFDPNLLHPAMALFRWPRSPLYIANGVSPNERPLLPQELRRDFEAAGMVDLRQRGQADIPYRHVAPKLLNACLSLYNGGDWLMARLGLGRVFGSFIITAARKPVAGAG